MNFFNPDYKPYTFQMFGYQHFYAVVVLFIMVFVLYKLRNKIRVWKYEKQLRYFLAVLIVLLELGIQAYNYFNQIKTLPHLAPLHLCGISAYLLAYTLITLDKRVFKILFFWALAGTINAEITPSTTFGWYGFPFWQFFGIHHMIIWIVLYFTFVHRFKVVYKDLYKALLILGFYSIPVIIYNYIFDTGFLFLNGKLPVNGSILDFLPAWPYYYPVLIIIAFVLFHLVYIIYKIFEIGKVEKPFKDENIILT